MSIESQILELVQKANPGNPLSFVQNIVKPMSKDKLDNAILSCEECEIACNSKKSITLGNPNASIMIIGESVSTEQQSGDSEVVYPFEDSSGQYLKDVLEYLNINQEQVFYINSVNCFPSRSGTKRPSTVAERNCCRDFLNYAIKIVEPLMIICLGAVAINGINEEIGRQKVNDIRGNYFMYRGVNVMPTFHPGYFEELRSRMPDELIEEYHSEFVSDITKAFTDLQEYYPEISIFNR